MKSLPGYSIPIGGIAFCASCDVAFATCERACPKCGAEAGIFRLVTGAAAAELAALRETLSLIEGALTQIVNGKFSQFFKDRLAKKALERIQKTKRPAAFTTGHREEVRYS